MTQALATLPAKSSMHNMRPMSRLIDITQNIDPLWNLAVTLIESRLLPSSIDINEALYDKLISAGIALHREGVSTVSTCHGVVTDEVYVASQADI